jgi:hypothetical protein
MKPACKICGQPFPEGDHAACAIALERKPHPCRTKQFVPPEVDETYEDLRDIAHDICFPQED